MVRRTVDGAGSRRRGAAAGVDAVVEERQVRLDVLRASARKNGGPRLLGVTEHVRDELTGLVIGRAGIDRLFRRGCTGATAEEAHDEAGIDAEEVGPDDGHEADDAELHAAATTAGAATAIVLDVLTFSCLAPTHVPDVS